MKRLIVLIVVLGGLGAGAWAIAAMGVETAAKRWLDDGRVEGWIVDASDVSIDGFPLVFATEFTALRLNDPETGLTWSTPRFRLEQDVYRLDRITAIFPETQLFETPVEELTLTASQLSAVLDVRPTANFALDAAEGVLRDLTLLSSLGWELTLGEAGLSVSQTADDPNLYAISGSAARLAPPEAFRTLLDPDNALPAEIETLTVAANTLFDAPWDRTALETARPQPLRIDIEDATLVWGDMLLRASGTLDVTPGGVPEGELDIRAENWRLMMDLTRNSGLLPERFVPTAEAMLQVLAEMNGAPEHIDATLTFSNGRVLLGPLPIGPAPSLRIR